LVVCVLVLIGLGSHLCETPFPERILRFEMVGDVPIVGTGRDLDSRRSTLRFKPFETSRERLVPTHLVHLSSKLLFFVLKQTVQIIGRLSVPSDGVVLVVG
jgi:hypothetical protein